MRSPSVLVAALSIALVASTSLAAGAPAGAAALPASSKATSTVPDGRAIPKGNVTTNGRTWKQTFRTGFDSAAPLGQFASKYKGIGLYDGYTDTSGRGKYAPSKVLSVKGGVLDFALHTEKGQPLVAAIMPDGYAPHKTGRVSIRYKTTNTAGYKFVGMLWPSSDDWNEGEIDWPEADLGSRPRPASAVPGTLSPSGMRFEPGKQVFAGSDTTAWHVATTEWDKGIVRFYWDGKLVASTTKAVPKTAFRVTLQAETAIGSAPIPPKAVGHVSIDWIAIWN
jgi:beta-glucanase (GH16 family)